MNLFDIDKKYCSHPEYPYKNHIKNIADTFNDLSHKQSASYHDLGKLCQAFQIYINSKDKTKNKTTHALAGTLIYLKSNNYNLNKESLAIFITILKHHGNLENVNSIANGLNDSEDILYKYSNLINLIKEIGNIINIENDFDIEEICDYFDEDEFVFEKNMSGIDSYFKIKEIFSKLIFADKYEAIFKSTYKEKPFENTEFYIEKLLKFLSNKNNDLSLIRNKARTDTIEKLKQNIDKNIFLIEAPTGIGKTFMALHLALEIIKTKDKKRLINTLPMTSIIDQTFDEYSNIFDDNVLMKYHHLSFSKEYYNPDKEKRNEEDSYKQKDSFINKSWSEDSVIITTFNQLLNLFYSNKNRDLIKFWTLRDSIIILDEIQAIPRILLKDFSETISFLAKEFNIDFILMSATVPDIKNYIDDSLICELLDNKYFSLEFNNRYALRVDNSINSVDKLVAEIIDKSNLKNSVLAVVNTKKLALSVYEQLKKEKSLKVFLLSSLFIPKHRKEIIQEIKKVLKNEKIILVSTQVIEAGVDLDFDCGFREFSPFYSIIQTAGRINRENRNEIRDKAELIIIPEIGYSPYHQNDLLKDIVDELISNKIREKSLLPLLKEYFKIAKERTSPDRLLIEKMENLEFENVIETFDKNFMKKLPNIIPVFIEIEKDLYNSFKEKLDSFYFDLKNKELTLEKKLELKIQIKEKYKEISRYVINVNKKDAEILPPFYNESEMKLCDFAILKNFYSKNTGWKIDGSALCF